jgi:DNA-binding GntR family transcriptional regulator
MGRQACQNSVDEHERIVMAARDGDQQRARAELILHSDHTKADLMAALRAPRP